MPGKRKDIGSQIAGFAGGIGGGLISGVMGPVLSVPLQEATYALNKLRPIIIPQPNDIISMMAHGFLDGEQADPLLKAHGIEQGYPHWFAAIQAASTFPSIEETVSGYWRSLVSSDLATKWIRHNGVMSGEVTNWIWGKPYIFPPELCRILYKLGFITLNTYRYWLAAAGLRRAEDRAAFEEMFTPLPLTQANELWNRGHITEDVAERWYALNGLTNPQTISGMKELRHQIPSPSQLIDFAVKEVWDNAIVTKFGYDDEFNNIPQFKHWMEKQGYGGNPALLPGQPGQPETWSQAFWRAHWRLVSNEQAFRMLHRLRPTGGPNNGPRFPFIPGTNTPVGVVSIDDVNAVLKVNDYPPFWRNKLAALSYNVLRLVDIRRVVFRSLEDEAFKEAAIGPDFTILQWAIEQFLDRGQRPEDANTLAQLSVHEGQLRINRKFVMQEAQAKGRLVKAFLQSYKLGTVTKQQAITVLVNNGWRTINAGILTDAIDREVSNECSRANIMSVKQRFMKGKIAETMARQLLTNIGVIQLRINHYITCWKSAMTESVVEEATSEIQEAVSQGSLSYDNAIEQLTNLGWTHPDQLLETAVVENELAGTT